MDEDLQINCELGIVKHTNQRQYYWMKLDAVKLLLKNKETETNAKWKLAVEKLKESDLFTDEQHNIIDKIFSEVTDG